MCHARRQYPRLKIGSVVDFSLTEEQVLLRDSVTKYSETGVINGSLNRIYGRDIMNILNQYAGFASKFGA